MTFVSKITNVVVVVVVVWNFEVMFQNFQAVIFHTSGNFT
jgi:hypothetical protein